MYSKENTMSSGPSRFSKEKSENTTDQWTTVTHNKRYLNTTPFHPHQPTDMEDTITVDIPDIPDIIVEPVETNRFVRGLNTLAKQTAEHAANRHLDRGFNRNFDVLHRLKGEQDSSRENYEEIKQYLYRRPYEQKKYTKHVVQEPVETSDTSLFPNLSGSNSSKSSGQVKTVWGEKNIVSLITDPVIASDKCINVKTEMLKEQEATEISILKDPTILFQDLLKNTMLVDEIEQSDDNTDIVDGFVTIKKKQKNKKTLY